jgi:hypothetical protein
MRTNQPKDQIYLNENSLSRTCHRNAGPVGRVASAQTNRSAPSERSLIGGAQMNGYGSPNQITGAPSSSNPQAGGGPNGLLTAPHSVPENGGAAMMEVNPPMRR